MIQSCFGRVEATILNYQIDFGDDGIHVIYTWYRYGTAEVIMLVLFLLCYQCVQAVEHYIWKCSSLLGLHVFAIVRAYVAVIRMAYRLKS